VFTTENFDLNSVGHCAIILFLLGRKQLRYTAIKQVTSPLFLTAAYGRKYETAKQALIAWYEGADFKIVDGPYCSVRDYEQMLQDFSNIYIYYGENEVVKV
jgi:hypothetical protein